MKTVILGAGISGLATAWRLKQANPSIDLTILEASSRAGGWIQTIDHEGFLFELGPRSCRSRGAGHHTLQLLEELGLCQEVVGADPTARHRYLWKDQQLKLLPSSLWGFLTSPLTRPLLRVLWKEWWRKPLYKEDESIAAFMTRRFSQETLDVFMDPLISGIYAGDPGELSMRSCFPELYRWEQEHGSVMRGVFKKSSPKEMTPFMKEMSTHSLFTFRRGMETLTKCLAEKLAPHIIYNAPVESLDIQKGQVNIRSKEAVFNATQVISTLPMHVLATVLPQLETVSIPYASVAVVCLGYRGKVNAKQGFGYLIPSSEQEKILGVVWDSSAFPSQNLQDNETRLTVMIGGTRMADFDSYIKLDFERIALEAVSRHMGIEQLPDAIYTHIARKAIPQYPVDHHKLIEQAKKTIPASIILGGTAFHGVSVNDCIAESSKVSHFSLR